MKIMNTLTMSKRTLAKMAVTAAAAVMLKIVLITRNPLRRLTLPAKIFRKLAFEAICIKLINSWVVDPSLNNLSCKF
jgi:hypothetical protein